MPDHLRVDNQPEWTPEQAREIGRRIRAARNAKGLSIDQVAELLGVSRGTPGHWESGARTIKLGDLVALCRELEVSSDELLFGKPHWPFKGISYRVVADLERPDIDKLEGGIMLVAAQIGVEVRQQQADDKAPPRKRANGRP